MAIDLYFALTVLLVSNAHATICRDHHYVQTFSGLCNNLKHPSWGQANRPFMLMAAPTHYNIAHLPNPRAVSNALCKEKKVVPNRRNMSELVTFFGQFVDHTITQTESSEVAWPITVPPNDPVFAKGAKIHFFRTIKKKRFRGYAANNLLSSYIDASSIYGSSKNVSDSLRTFWRGKLKASANGLPTQDERGLFRSGDKRLNENPLLTAFHALFIREHNAVADEVHVAFPHMDEEGAFQLTRKVVIAQLQAVVYYEFLPAVLGRELPKYRGYEKNVKAAISSEFSTVGFRVGHTMINENITSVDARGAVRTRRLREAFFNPRPFVRNGIDDLFRGMMATRTAEVDTQVTSAVRDFLFELDKSQIDLAAVNIQRGRDHGVVPYNRLRQVYGLPPARTFADITTNVDLQHKLREVYGTVHRVDAWVGGIAEDHVRGASMGQLFVRIWIWEFNRLRHGDRFYFEKWGQFKWKEISRVPTLRKLLLEKSSLRHVMRNMIVRNTGIPQKHVPKNPFFV